MVLNGTQQVVLRKSAVRTMVMAAVRHDGVGMAYGDYERADGSGACREIHLLDWNEGRLRDTTDFGPAILFLTSAVRDIGGLNEQYKAADLYDLRLRVSERHLVTHVANRYAGSLYRVAAPARTHERGDTREQSPAVHWACYRKRSASNGPESRGDRRGQWR